MPRRTHYQIVKEKLGIEHFRNRGKRQYNAKRRDYLRNWKRKRAQGNGGILYLVTDGEAVKIGYTSCDLLWRLKGIQHGNPREITVMASVPGNKATERSLHDRFATHRIRGEWYRVEVAPILLSEWLRDHQ